MTTAGVGVHHTSSASTLMRWGQVHLSVFAYLLINIVLELKLIQCRCSYVKDEYALCKT